MAGLDTAYRNGEVVRWRRDEWARLHVRREMRRKRPDQESAVRQSRTRLQQPTEAAAEAARRIMLRHAWIRDHLAPAEDLEPGKAHLRRRPKRRSVPEPS